MSRPRSRRFKTLFHKRIRRVWRATNHTYCSATDSETTTFGRFYTGKGCRAMSHMSAFPEFFVRSRSVKCKHHPSILHFLMKITPLGEAHAQKRGGFPNPLLNNSGSNVLQLVWCGSLEGGLPAQVPSSSSD
ncbi:hypothetical protein AVEN_35712-1 [Araneus ventricosus]|uniref:Uncharacterized protein n=1 Tax=Araneus ventricosus TaxID=182803 RepID=A0A4Y2HYB1_ARAVE|nr:hypothetical protein AVEN_35712-1 [Araneus ventricosus]